MARDVRIVIEVKTKDARKDVQDLDSDVGGLNSTSVAAGAAITKSFGNVLKAAGGLVSAGIIVQKLTQAVRHSVDVATRYEAALTAVQKTTGLSRQEIRLLGGDVTELSTRLGVSQFELAAIAETAGQLGIQSTQDILALTDTVAKLSNVTELTADQAAEQIARISNSFNLPIENAEKLGSVLNELSNTTTAKAGDVSDGLSRIGTAGSAIGITVDQASALTAVLIDAGIESRRAGTSLRNTFIRMQTEAEKLGAVVGVTGAEFTAMVEEDALAALRAYLDGLRAMPPALAAVKIKEVFGDENFLAVQTLSTQTDLLNKNLATANKAFEEGTSLGREFAVQMATVAKQWDVLRANVEAFATAAGTDALPMLFDLLSGVNDLLGGVDRLADGILRLRAQMGATEEAGELIARYEDLAGKTNRTAEESRQLRQVTDELAARFPGMIKGYDDLGEVTGVYADSIRQAVEQQRALLRLQESEQMQDMGAEFADAIEQLERLRRSQSNLEGRPSGEILSPGGFGASALTVGEALASVRQNAAATELAMAKVARQVSRLFDPKAVSTQQLMDELDLSAEAAARLNLALRAIAQERANALGGGDGSEGGGGGGGGGEGALELQRELQALRIELMQEGLQKELAQIEFAFEERKRMIREKFPEEADELIQLLEEHRQRLRDEAFGIEDLVRIDGSEDLGPLKDVIEEFEQMATQAEENVTAAILRGAEQRVEAREREIEAEERLQEEKRRTLEMVTQAAVMRAETTQDVLNVIRQEIKAEIALAIAKQAAKVLATVPWPFNIAVAAGVGASVGALFEQIVPEFRRGGDDVGGLVKVHQDEIIALPQGSNVVSQANSRRIVQALERDARPSAAGFSDERLVRSNMEIAGAVHELREQMRQMRVELNVRDVDEHLVRFRDDQERT